MFSVKLKFLTIMLHIIVVSRRLRLNNATKIKAVPCDKIWYVGLKDNIVSLLGSERVNLKNFFQYEITRNHVENAFIFWIAFIPEYVGFEREFFNLKNIRNISYVFLYKINQRYTGQEKIIFLWKRKFILSVS